MATENGPDLDPAREAVERLMDDTCTITAFDGREALDPDTGVVVRFPGEEIYGADTLGSDDRELGGMCKIRPDNAIHQDDNRGGSPQRVGAYILTLPWDAPEIPLGATATITSSRRDPQLVGREYTVTTVHRSTMLIQRRIRVEERS